MATVDHGREQDSTAITGRAAMKNIEMRDHRHAIKAASAGLLSLPPLSIARSADAYVEAHHRHIGAITTTEFRRSQDK